MPKIDGADLISPWPYTNVTALRRLNPEDSKSFSEFLVLVFSDIYAAVPHLSLARIIAMFNAGLLNLKATGNDADFANNSHHGVTITTGDEILNFDVMVDASGQASAGNPSTNCRFHLCSKSFLIMMSLLKPHLKLKHL